MRRILLSGPRNQVIGGQYAHNNVSVVPFLLIDAAAQRCQQRARYRRHLRRKGSLRDDGAIHERFMVKNGNESGTGARLIPDGPR